MDFIYVLIIPDLSPVDYKTWSDVQQWVYQSRAHNVDKLEQRLVHIWHGINQTIIDNAIDVWRGCLRDCVWAKGGHFDQLLWQYEQAYHSAVWQ